MRSRTGEAIGRRIKAARESAGLTQEGLAEAVRLDRSALTKIERGDRKVSALELAAIADRLDVRIEWFIDDAPIPVVSRRNSREPGAASPTIDRLTERIAREVEFVQAHDAQLGSLTPAGPLPRPTNHASIERAAESARQLISASAEEPLYDLAKWVGNAGLLAFSIELGADSADGSSMHLDDIGIAVVNASGHLGRRRLTLAHELGHFLFADEFSVDWQVADPDQGDTREARIDRFARALLLPSGALQRDWAFHKDDGRSAREAAVITASRYRVDMSTLARRLTDLRIVSAGEAQQIRDVRTTRADMVEFDLFVPEELANGSLPRPYVEAVLRLYRHEVVSAARALDLLLDTWDEADLPDLPTLPEQAIWTFVS